MGRARLTLALGAAVAGSKQPMSVRGAVAGVMAREAEEVVTFGGGELFVVAREDLPTTWKEGL